MSSLSRPHAATVDDLEDIVQIGRSTGVARRTGTAFDSPEVHIWRVRDGRVTNLRSYIDTVEVAAALRG